MAVDAIDFEGNGALVEPNNANPNPANQPDVTDLHGGTVDDVTGKDGNTPPNSGATQTPDVKDDNPTQQGEGQQTSSTGGLEPGTEIEYDGAVYTVAENGDIVDKDGNVFKEAKDAAKWIEESETSDDKDDILSFDSIKEAIGIDVTDENGNPVEFTNDTAGVKSYIDSVIELKAKDIQEGAINKLFNDNPLVKQFIDYVQLTGTPKGFGDIPDRSGIVLDKDNEHQLEAVIRMAAKEFGNKSLNDNYIKYLKDSGALYDEAKAQLEALVGKDKAYRKEIETQAQAAREQEQKEIAEFWQDVSNAIEKRVIGSYKLPENFVKEIDGKKITLTLKDFYKYVAQAIDEDEDGNPITGYKRDLNKLSKEEALNKELLDAWLTFTGGSYKDLIDMAVKEEKVRRLVIKSNERRSSRTIKVNKPKQGKVNMDDIILG